MEEHRLKEMGTYDESRFNRLYKSMTPLKRKLASNISYQRLGLEYKDILAEFDIKFLFAYHKYQSFDENKLQAHLIRALQFYKCRILREIYKEKNSSTKVEINDQTEYEHGLIDTSIEDSKAYQLETAIDWINKNLSPDGRKVFVTELNPPAYIINKLQIGGRKVINHIPASLVCEYLGWENTQAQLNRISDLRKEIRYTVQLARTHFKRD